MKTSLLFFFVLLTQQAAACSCMPGRLLNRIADADFIATVKVSEITRAKNDENVHDIKIEIIELYKGEKTDQLKVYTRLLSSCGFHTPINTTWLIFAYKNKNGDLGFGYCSGSKQIDREFQSHKYTESEVNKVRARYKKSIEKKAKVLSYLRDKELLPVNTYDLRTYFLNNCVSELRGYKVENEPFAFYELTINTDLTVEKIVALKQFDNNELNLKLKSFLRDDILIGRSGKTNSIPVQTKILLGLYFYPANGTRSSFIARNIL